MVRAGEYYRDVFTGEIVKVLKRKRGERLKGGPAGQNYLPHVTARCYPTGKTYEMLESNLVDLTEMEVIALAASEDA